MKIIQITDTHFSPEMPYFNGNLAPLAAWIAASGADIVIHTGDISVDGALRPKELTDAITALRAAIDLPLLVVPGNHDIGHLADVTPARIAAWHTAVGPDRWVHDQDGWRLIGLNALLIGSNLPEEAAQIAWLTERLEQSGELRTAIFAHCPLFMHDASEGDTGYWAAPPAARQSLLALCEKHGVALYASGHTHRAQLQHHQSMALVWAPPAGFLVRDYVDDVPGANILGAALHILGDDVQSTLIAIPGLRPNWLDDVMDTVYPGTDTVRRPAP